MKKVIAILMILSLVMVSSVSAFAATEVGTQPPIPVWLTAPGIGGTGGSEGGGGETVGGGIDFSITEKIPMTVRPGSSELSFPNIKVTNNAATGQLKISKIEGKAVNGWTLKRDNEKYFSRLKADTKELSIVADNVHDFAVNSVYVLGDTKLVPPKSSNIVELSGHIGTFTKAMKCIVANLIPTIAIY